MKHYYLVPNTRIELVSFDYQSKVLTNILIGHYIHLVVLERIELSHTACKAIVLPLN
jgi:hypothetical protein